jgi:dihydrodipicolinate synthase/N-acetylneuraminate lyase
MSDSSFASISIDPIRMLRPRRRIVGMSAVLLPFSRGEIDWKSFAAHLARTAEAGLTTAVNMDTGYVNLLDYATRLEVIRQTRSVLGSQPFVVGAIVADRPGDRFDLAAYMREVEPIATAGGTPIIFQSYGLTERSDDGIVAAYSELGEHIERFFAFELGTMFAPFGRIYSLETYRSILGVRQCIGAKHSSLNRDWEWQRLALRDALRPDFLVLTGNDLAIDMVMYGSDYLLGLSTFVPEQFARRDALWSAGDAAFFELNDTLQYLGNFAFRPPVPAYKHSAAMFLHLCGRIESDATHPSSPTRPASDRQVLSEIARRLNLIS